MAQVATVSPVMERMLTPGAAIDVPVRERSADGLSSVPPAYLFAALEDAESLLKYAAEAGIEIEDKIRNYVLQARTAGSSGWDPDVTEWAPDRDEERRILDWLKRRMPGMPNMRRVAIT